MSAFFFLFPSSSERKAVACRKTLFHSCFLVFLFAVSPTTTPAAPTLPSLQDQFGSTVTLPLGRGYPVVIVTSDRRSSPEDIAAWASLLSPMPAGIELYCLPNLKWLPFFVPQDSVIRKLQENHRDLPMCLDWKGRVAASLGAPQGDVGVIVFGPGSLGEVGRVVGPASAGGAAAARALMLKALGR